MIIRSNLDKVAANFDEIVETIEENLDVIVPAVAMDVMNP